MPISPTLQAYLDSHRISQRALSRKTDINQANISLIFNGLRSPTLDTLKRIAAGMDIEVSTLIRLMRTGEEQS